MRNRKIEEFFDFREGVERRAKPERRVSARLTRKVTWFAVSLTVLTVALHVIAPPWGSIGVESMLEKEMLILQKIYGADAFLNFDREMKVQCVPEYYQETYGKPFSLVTLAQVLSESRGSTKIDAELSEALGRKVKPKFFSSSLLPRLKLKFLKGGRVR